MQGTNKARKNGEAMGLVGVRLTAELGHGGCAKRPCPSSVTALPLPERWRAPMGGQRFTSAPKCSVLALIKQHIEWHQHNAKTPGSDGEAMTAASCFKLLAWRRHGTHRGADCRRTSSHLGDGVWHLGAAR